MDLKELNLKLRDLHFEVEKTILGLKIKNHNPSSYATLSISSSSNEAYMNTTGVWVYEEQIDNYKKDIMRCLDALQIISSYLKQENITENVKE